MVQRYSYSNNGAKCMTQNVSCKMCHLSAFDQLQRELFGIVDGSERIEPILERTDVTFFEFRMNLHRQILLWKMV